MAKTTLRMNEKKVQETLAGGAIAEAKKLLQRCDDIRPVYRKIFEAAISFAEEDYRAVWEAVTEGLKLDYRNYELYMLLGDYYVLKNPRQAYLCYENALFYCDEMQDREQIRVLLEEYSARGYAVPRAAIVILSYNLLDMTRDCIESIRKTTPESAREIIVIDNASKDKSVEWLSAQKDIKLLCNGENKGFPAACNQGIGLADAESDIFLLNNDTVMTDNALFWLRMGLYESEQVGSAGSVTNHMSNFQTVVEDGKSEKEYREFAAKNNVPMEYPYQNKLYLTGFALLLKRDVLNRTGLLDERFFPGNFEDNDLCLRINLAGFRNVLCKNSFIIHWGSSSFKKEPEKFQSILDNNQRKFFDKWSGIGLDPEGYWNIRLDLISMLEKEGGIFNDNILVVGTGCGSLLSCLKDRFPAARVYGMEQHQYMAQISDRIAETFWVDLDEWKGDELADTFDFIVVNDMLEYTSKPQSVLTELVKTLKRDGHVVLSFANKNHYSRIGKNITTRRLYDRSQMIEMLFHAGLTKNNWNYTQIGGRTPELERKVRALQEQYSVEDGEELYAYQWMTVVEKQRTDIQFGSKMVVCIPTYRHPKAVEDVLAQCAETYKRYGLDVYYYDSSEDDKTRKIIENYQRKGYDNLNYISMNQVEVEDTKTIHILNMDGINKQYEYMWFLRDRCWCEEKTLKLIYEAVSTSYDLIFMDVGHPECKQKLSECKNANEFYHRCGDYVTSMDTSIYNVQSILRGDFSIERFYEKHGEYRKAFLYFLLIFERLSQKEEPNICLLAGDRVTIFHSRKAQSRWHEQRINIWGKQWLEANESLPDCYTDREDVIKRTASFPWILGDLNALKDLHERGVLTPEYFEEIKVFWEKVSNIPLEVLRQIAYGENIHIHDPLRLKENASTVLNILLQIYEAVLNNSLALEKVPIREIVNTVNEQIAKSRLEDIVRETVGDSLFHVGKLAEEGRKDKERMLMMLQMFISIQALLER